MENIPNTSEREERQDELSNLAYEVLNDKRDELTKKLIRRVNCLKDCLDNDLSWELNNTEIEDEDDVEYILDKYVERFKELCNMEEIKEILKNC